MDFNGLLTGKTALVTGASRGIGRGIAAALSDAGARVYATGRTIANATLPESVTRLTCDHRNDDEVSRVFEQISRESGRLDVLANAAWGGYDGMVENGKFTWVNPFWDQPMRRWSARACSMPRSSESKPPRTPASLSARTPRSTTRPT